MTTEEIKAAARAHGVKDWFFNSIEDFISDYTPEMIVNDWNILKALFPDHSDFN